MKKHLLLLPLAGLALSGCQFEIFGNTIRLFEKDPDFSTLPENFKAEVEGHKIATYLKNGGKYILAVYRINEGIVRFADGNYHSDDNGQYSFYLGTSTKVSEAAIVEAKSLGKGEFSLRMIAEGKPWHNKYIGIYAAQSEYENNVLSICALDSLDQTTFETINKKIKKTVTAETQTHFKYISTYEDLPAYSVAAYYQHKDNNDEEAVPKFLGTGHNQSTGEPDYISMDCKSYETALSLDAYDLAHLYEA